VSDSKQCPACGETILAVARMCKFCRYDFRAPVATPQAPPKKSNTTLIVIIVIVVGVVLIVPCLAALLLPAIARAIRNAKVTSCANNMAQLWKMQSNYMVTHGGSQKSLPRERGEKFWLKLSETDPPLVDRNLGEIYQCPMEGATGWGTCDYRGPSSTVNLYGDGDPVGADKERNHGSGEGGNVLRKSGDVQSVGSTDPLWKLAEKKTMP